MSMLQAELTKVQEDLATAKGQLQVNYTDFQANVVKQLETKEAEILARMEHEEEIVSNAADPTASFTLAVDGYESDFRALAGDEDKYQYLSITTQLYLSKIEHEHELEIKALRASYESEIEAADNRTASVEAELDQSREDLADTRKKLENAINQVGDGESERENLKREVEILRKQVSELREQITEKPVAQTNIDGRESLAELKAKIEAKKIPVYNVRAGDHKTSFFIAQRVDTGEEIEIRPYYEFKAKYREITDPNEIERFRSEYEASKAEVVDESVEIPVSVEPPAIEFQPSELAPETVGEPVSDGTGESGVLGGGGEVTRAEFEALAKRVKDLEYALDIDPNEEAA